MGLESAIQKIPISITLMSELDRIRTLMRYPSLHGLLIEPMKQHGIELVGVKYRPEDTHGYVYIRGPKSSGVGLAILEVIRDHGDPRIYRIAAEALHIGMDTIAGSASDIAQVLQQGRNVGATVGSLLSDKRLIVGLAILYLITR